MFSLLFLSLNPAKQAISLFAFLLNAKAKGKTIRNKDFFFEHKNNKKYFETCVCLGLLNSTMFSLLFLLLNPAMHAILLFAFVSTRIIKSVFETCLYFCLLDSTLFSCFQLCVCVVSMFACVWVISLFITKGEKGKKPTWFFYQKCYAFKPFSRWIFVLPPFCGELVRGVLCCLNII
jgi:hypothetical protein